MKNHELFTCKYYSCGRTDFQIGYRIDSQGYRPAFQKPWFWLTDFFPTQPKSLEYRPVLFFLQQRRVGHFEKGTKEFRQTNNHISEFFMIISQQFPDLLLKIWT